MEYDVVQSRSLSVLIDTVREKIKYGWRPIGGISATPVEDANVYNRVKYLQAMVRETGGIE